MPARPRPFLDRFWEKVNKLPGEDACWVWTGALTGEPGKGYPVIWFRGKQVGGHVISYLFYRGEIPAGYTIDHLCRNRSCIRPDHLDVKTRGQNVLVGTGLSADNARKTHCKHGHPFDDANTWVAKDGSRHCRACSRDRVRSKYREEHGIAVGDEVPDLRRGAKTHCGICGLPMGGDNLYVSPKGLRQCRACNKRRADKRRARMRAA